VRKVIISKIISGHIEESSFLWLLRANAVAAPHYSLKDFAKLDNRVEAHLDGLRIAADEGWELVKELKWEEPGEFFAAAELAFGSEDKSRINLVLERLTKVPAGLSGVISALGWLPLEKAKQHISPLLASLDPVLRRVGLAAAAIHRFSPGPALGKALIDSDLLLRARGLKAVGELGRTELAPTLRQNLKGEDLACRYWAAWSLALLAGDPLAISALRSIAEAGNKFSERAVAVYARRADPQAVKEWYRKAKLPMARLGIVAAGALGDIDGIPWLLGLMNQKPLARAAGEAFTFITGADLALLNLENKPPTDFQSGPTEDPKDEDVSMDPDDNLPWPNPEKVGKWWEKNRGGFAPGTRYLLGKPMEIASLNEVLRIGKQRQRAASATELAIRQPGTPLFETRMAGFRQRQILGV